jgi:CRP-like cAMP-binding protein
VLTENAPSADGLRHRLLLLRAMNNFGELDDATMVLLAEHARERRFRADDIILREGEPIERVHLLVSGKIEVSRHGKVAALLDGSGTVGMLPLLARCPEGARAVALAASHTLELPTEVVLDLYEESFFFLRTAIRFSAMGLLERRGSLPVPPDYQPPADPGTYRETEPTLVERILSMRSNPLFADRNLDAVVDMARIGKPFRAAAGSTLWTIGEPADWHLAMSYGRIRCTNAAGESVTVAGGYALGIMDSLSRSSRCYTAVCDSEIQAVRVEVSDLLSVFETHHDLAMDLLAMISRQLLPKP